MIRRSMIAAAMTGILALSSTAFAQGQGTADEAKAMLAKTGGRRKSG